MSNSSTTKSELQSLAKIISDNVQVIDNVFTRSGQVYPSLHEAYQPDSELETLVHSDEVLSTALLAISAASQLVASLKLPGLNLFERACGFSTSAALRIVSEASVAEILREAGSQGLDANDIASKSGTDPTIMVEAHSLRLLSTHYIFKEVKPNVFANNRNSSFLDTGKKSAQLLGGKTSGKATSVVREDKYRGISGVSALIELCTEDGFKAGAFLPDVAQSNDTNKTAFQRAFNTDMSVRQFNATDRRRMERVQAGMAAWKHVLPGQDHARGFNWRGLPDGALVVDVGGGNGSQSFEIAKQVPHVKVVVQDKEETIAQATIPTWEANPAQKSLLDQGSVSIEAHNFFEPQPPHIANRAAVFHARFIIHDWPTEDCIKILRNLSQAATEHTRLLIVDLLVSHACSPQDTPLLQHQIDGLEEREVPAPLLHNLGAAYSDVYFLDFVAKALVDGHERTIEEFVDLFRAGGWELVKVHRSPGSCQCQLECKLIS